MGVSRWRTLRTLVVIGLLGLGCSGCSSLQCALTHGADPVFFGGTRADLALATGRDCYDESTVLLGWVDLPLSVVADTVLLPMQLLARAIASPGEVAGVEDGELLTSADAATDSAPRTGLADRGTAFR